MKLLNPEIKEWADKIYQVDRQKFQRIAGWIKGAERTYSVETIVATLKDFYPHAKAVSNHWWPYLDKALEQHEGRINGSNAQAESEQHKKESLGQFGAILDRIRDGKGLP
jgi:hypothetical protein